MTYLHLHRLLESIQCLICPDCVQFKRITRAEILLFICGKCRRFLSTCSRQALNHACCAHPALRFDNVEQLAAHFDHVFVVHSFAYFHYA